MVGQAGTPGNDGGGARPQPTDGSLQPPVFDPPLSLPAPRALEEEGEAGNRKRVLWAFGAAAALFGAGVVGLSLPAGSNDGVNVRTDDTTGSTTTVPGPKSEEDVRTLVAPVFAPFTFSAGGTANTTSTTDPSLLEDGTSVRVSVLAGVVARGTTSIRITPATPVPDQPGTSAPSSGTTSPTTPATTAVPTTTRPPRPPRTTTTTIPTTPATDPPTTDTTIPTTPPTDPPTTETTIPTTPPTDPPTTDTTLPPTTLGTTTVFEVPTSPETAPTTPPSDPPSTPPSGPPST